MKVNYPEYKIFIMDSSSDEEYVNSCRRFSLAIDKVKAARAALEQAQSEEDGQEDNDVKAVAATHAYNEAVEAFGSAKEEHETIAREKHKELEALVTKSDELPSSICEASASLNLPAFKAAVEEAVEGLSQEQLDGISVYTQIKRAAGEEVVIDGTLCGPLKSVMEVVNSAVLGPEQTVQLLQQTAQRLFSSSDVDAVIFSLVSRSAGVGGQAVVNRFIDVPDESLIMLASAAAGQVEMFKDHVENVTGQSLDPKNKIITPGDAAFNGGPNLRLV
jgi:hypothetical protein